MRRVASRRVARKRKEEHIRTREEYVQLDGGFGRVVVDRKREKEREGGWEEEGGREREDERGAAPTPTRSIRYTSAHQLFGNGDEWEGWPV